MQPSPQHILEDFHHSKKKINEALYPLGAIPHPPHPQTPRSKQRVDRADGPSLFLISRTIQKAL